MPRVDGDAIRMASADDGGEDGQTWPKVAVGGLLIAVADATIIDVHEHDRADRTAR